MINIAILVFNSFQENTYVVSDGTGECIIVDPGNVSPRENEAISQFIKKNSLKPVMVVNTHGHIDHILGVQYLKDTYAIPFALDGRDAFLVESAPVHGRMYGFEMESAPKIDIDLNGRDTVEFGDTKLQIIRTPGHTPGHISLYSPEEKFVLTGDTLFKGSIGRTDLPGGDYKQIMESIIGKLIPLGGEVNVYPGHGPSTSIAAELDGNPFITEVIEGEVNF